LLIRVNTNPGQRDACFHFTGKEDYGRFLEAMEAKMEMPEDDSLFGNY